MKSPGPFRGIKRRNLGCFPVFCNLHAPKSPVKRRILKLFHMFFLRMAAIRRTFALAIGTQAPPALLDTPLGESPLAVEVRQPGCSDI